jgi:copper chaperone CopZ
MQSALIYQIKNKESVMLRFVAWAVVVAVFAGCGGEVEKESSGAGNQVFAASFNPDDAPTVEFSVPDMMCPEGCGVAVEGILSKQPGVKGVVIDFEGKTAKVAIEEGTFDEEKALAALIDKQFLNSKLKTESVAKPQAADGAVVQ